MCQTVAAYKSEKKKHEKDDILSFYYDFCIKRCSVSPLPPVVCRRVHVLLTLFVFACAQCCPTHIVLCFCFVCLRLVYPMLPVSLDCSFLIDPSVFSNVYLYPIKLCLIKFVSDISDIIKPFNCGCRFCVVMLLLFTLGFVLLLLSYLYCLFAWNSLMIWMILQIKHGSNAFLSS